MASATTATSTTRASTPIFNRTSSIETYPSKAELLSALPPELTHYNPIKAWGSLIMSAGLSLAALGIGTQIPLTLQATPLWGLYGIGCGTIAMGCWVLAHECGHNAFHPNRRIEGVVGFLLHSALLVPYYSWARSHSVHHAHCNHLEQGETHVPPRATSLLGQITEQLKRKLNPTLFGIISLFNHLVIGWQLYLLLGATGGEDYGFPTSHFWNGNPFTNGKRNLFPEAFRTLMVRSNIGCLAMITFLIIAAIQSSPLRVLCVYGLPYLVINVWLTTYTWLQHTDQNIPHFSNKTWSWAKGALQTVDRPYGPVLNLLHHGIGSTHVCHHVNSAIPHYNAWRGTALLRQRFPELARYDSTPIPEALWRVATRCGGAVYKNSCDEAYYF
ncbi:delta-12 fatty acid desaturase DesA2 [Synechococcus sp. MEDNS5]|uniref:fatty acid desaturase n=1 Tax=Synechococcus sp. MEDNS5 TaxID=1442554 RepID=UPI000CA0E598|nr:fatty acid desaturase [Synechococcus sp. MEDNS5]ATV95749.1 delta-12 fatty acid desaturase [Synechococcus sp. MEDNS5]QNJ06439.1 delta-12 fatty acid desaturase DesA2 [Synechococcus sp. MEDNS5]